KADAHRVDNDDVVVGGVEVRLPAHSRHPDTVPLPADAAHDARHQMPCLGVNCRIEPQGIEIGDRPLTHREHVAHDAADARRRTLVRLDVGWMIVALHLEDDAVSVPEINDASVLTGPLNDLWPRGR